MWVSQFLGPKARIASDQTEGTILNSIAGTPNITYVANLFETENFTSGDAFLIRQAAIKYVFADYRLTTEIPSAGANFAVDPLSGLYARPLPVDSLTKFDHIAGISRIFDDGTIVIYSLQGSLYYQSKA
jgi:hypothetical protein